MAEVPEVDYTAEEEAAMGGETQPEGETPSVKTPEGVEADPTEVRTSADLLNKHQEFKAAITRLLAQSKAKVSSLMAFGVEALLDQGEVGVSLWRSLIRQRVVVTAPTRDNFVLLPRVSAIQKTEDWRIEILKEEAKE